MTVNRMLNVLGQTGIYWEEKKINVYNRWWWVVSFTTQPPYPWTRTVAAIV